MNIPEVPAAVEVDCPVLPVSSLMRWCLVGLELYSPALPATAEVDSPPMPVANSTSVSGPGRDRHSS
jgi:hypothetical protein